ncbi:unnamed protein product [Eruca vesicaria subsp. sativa]|uniref:Uncharacterized protein n=1 Tax=Eruca vesicaria subsp. sativa TaxID=29727 RepID=A0ABC8LE16_ERUVS|nr:unnamed protein product [Eruca vesicaria subsp. sativa]
MRRTKENDVLRESSFNRYGKKKHKTFPFPKSEEPDLMNQSACDSLFGRDNYYGAKATINVRETIV